MAPLNTCQASSPVEDLHTYLSGFKRSCIQSEKTTELAA